MAQLWGQVEGQGAAQEGHRAQGNGDEILIHTCGKAKQIYKRSDFLSSGNKFDCSKSSHNELKTKEKSTQMSFCSHRP